MQSFRGNSARTPEFGSILDASYATESRHEVPEGLIDEIAILHARVEALEMTFGKMAKKAKDAATHAAQKVKQATQHAVQKVKDATKRITSSSHANKKTEHSAVDPQAHSEGAMSTLKELLDQKGHVYGTDKDGTVMVQNMNNTFYFSEESGGTIKAEFRINGETHVKGGLTPKQAIHILQGRNIQEIFAPPMPECSLTTAAQVPRTELLRYSAAILSKQKYKF